MNQSRENGADPQFHRGVEETAGSMRKIVVVHDLQARLQLVVAHPKITTLGGRAQPIMRAIIPTTRGVQHMVIIPNQSRDPPDLL